MSDTLVMIFGISLFAVYLSFNTDRLYKKVECPANVSFTKNCYQIGTP